MGLSGRITHVIGYIGLYWTVWDRFHAGISIG